MAERTRSRFSLATVLVGLMLLAGVLPASAAGHVEQIASFDANAGELVEGITIDKRGAIYLSASPLGQLWRIPPGETTPEVFGSLPEPLNQDDLGLIGLAVDAPGNVYGGVVSTNPNLNGVWKFDRRSGAAYRLPGTGQIGLANGLAFDKRGNLYVTDSAAAKIWRVDKSGVVSEWVSDPLLEGTGVLVGIPIGANGIAYRNGTIYAAVTEQGTVVQIPVNPDGSAGTVSVLAAAPELFAADGLALDVHGDIFVAVIGQFHVAKVDGQTGATTIVASGGPVLDTSSVAFGTGRGERMALFAVNFGILSGFPGLIKIDAGVPGMPLP